MHVSFSRPLFVLACDRDVLARASILALGTATSGERERGSHVVLYGSGFIIGGNKRKCAGINWYVLE